MSLSTCLPSEPAAAILIVEDEALVSGLIRDVLEDIGFAVAGVASTGVEAVALAGAHIPDLALVDIRLAGPIDGIEVALQLRSRFGVRSIFLTGNADPATISRARAAQPVGFLEKPFRPSQVFKALQHALARPGAR
jgi:CheY-like chemotaxis protein